MRADLTSHVLHYILYIYIRVRMRIERRNYPYPYNHYIHLFMLFHFLSLFMFRQIFCSSQILGGCRETQKKIILAYSMHFPNPYPIVTYTIPPSPHFFVL